MQKAIVRLMLAFFLVPSYAYAGTVVKEGAEAKTLYEAAKATAQVLAQKDKIFILRAPGGAETKKPKEMTVKVGETIYLTNEEEKYVHNVYDNSDNSWVLKKQAPSEVAAITFNAAGKHKLRCAIHPKMKIKVIVK